MQQLAPPLVEHEVEPEERLQPPAEPRLRPPRPLRDRPDLPPRRGVEVDDAIGLAVADAAQDDRLGLERSRRTPLSMPDRARRMRASVSRRSDRDRVADRGGASPSPPRRRPASGRTARGFAGGARGEAEGDVAVHRGEGRIDGAGDAGGGGAGDHAAVALVERGVGADADQGRVALGDPAARAAPPSRPAARRRAASRRRRPRGPARTEPSSSITSPAALTAAIAATVSPAPVTSAAYPTPPRDARSRPSELGHGGAGADADPAALGNAARRPPRRPPRPSSGPGRAFGSPSARS